MESIAPGFPPGLSAERMRHMHQVEGANPSALTICPCGVVQTTRLPLMQETGAKPVRDANFRRVVRRGTADPPDSESGSLGPASRLAPTSSPSKHDLRPQKCPPKATRR